MVLFRHHIPAAIVAVVATVLSLVIDWAITVLSGVRLPLQLGPLAVGTLTYLGLVVKDYIRVIRASDRAAGRLPAAPDTTTPSPRG